MTASAVLLLPLLAAVAVPTVGFVAAPFVLVVLVPAGVGFSASASISPRSTILSEMSADDEASSEGRPVVGSGGDAS